VADARFAKPLDQDLVRRLAREHEVLVFRPLTLPDVFIDHDKPAVQIEMAGLDAPHIVASVLEALGRGGEALEAPARA
jgi:1-deoxy-D-xylulose-5-phosphate synthase